MSKPFTEVVLALVRLDDRADLSMRQAAVLVATVQAPELQTLRALARDLNVSKPAITRALDRLGDLGLVRRIPDKRDRRSILAQPTPEGIEFATRDMGAIAQPARTPMVPA